MTITRYFKHYFMWSNYQPADEREVALYHQARKQSYYFLGAVLVYAPWISRQVYDQLTTPSAYIYLIAYTLLGLLLAEWVGGYTMRRADLSLNKYLWFANKEFSLVGLGVLIGLGVLSNLFIYLF